MKGPGFWDVAIALPMIAIGLGLAATGILMFVGLPMAMIGIELLAGER